MAESRGDDRVRAALRGTSTKRNSRERKELTDPDLRDSAVEKPDDPSSENYGPRNPSVKQKPEARYSKSEVNYTDEAKGRDDCDDCVHFQGREERTCALVKGAISPEGWCRKFEAQSGERDEESEKEES